MRMPTRPTSRSASWPATARRCAGSSNRARSTDATSSRSACAATGRRRRPSTGCRSTACAGTSCARSRSAAPRRSSPTRSPRRSTAPTSIYLSLDIDVIDPGMAPGTGTPEPGGMLTREVLRADPPDRRRRRARRDGHRRGLAALRPGRDDRDGREPGRARGHQRARGQAPGRRPDPLGGLTHRPRPARRAGPARRADDLARLYDLDLVDDPGDLDLYLALAERTGGPILELAAGTGRLAVPLAAAGQPGHGGRPRSGDARPRPAERPLAGPAGDRAPRPSSRPTSSACDCPRPAASASRSSRSTRCSCCPTGRPSAPRSRRSPTTSHPAAWRSSTSGCPTPRTWPGSTAASSSSGRASDPETGELVTKSGSAQHDAATGTITADHDLRGVAARAARPGAGSAATACASSRPTSSRHGRRMPGWPSRLIAGGYDLGALGPGSERAILLAVKP